MTITDKYGEALVKIRNKRLELSKKEREIYRKIGEQTRKNRKASGVSLRQAARTFGISAAYLSDIETGRRNCPDKLIYFEW